MKITLRNRHRMIWMLLVFTVPIFLAYTMQLALSNEGQRSYAVDDQNCEFTAVASSATEVADYRMDNGECSYALHAYLQKTVRSPELAMIVSKNPIVLDNLSGAGVKYFEGNRTLSIDLALPTSTSYEVVIADMLRGEVIDRTKLTVK